MRKSKYTAEQVAQALQDYEANMPLEEICKQLDISIATFYNWRKRYAGLSQSDLQQVIELQEENRGLKQQVEDLLRDRDLLQTLVSKLGDPGMPVKRLYTI